LEGVVMSEDQSGSDEAILQQVPSMCNLLGLNRFRLKKLIWGTASTLVEVQGLAFQ